MAGACKAARRRSQVLVATGEATGPSLYNMRCMDPRVFSPLDRLLELADSGLSASFGRPASSRPTPGKPAAEPVDPARRRHAAGLMRVNHAGEIAAQGLYHGQALTARAAETRDALRRAAAEEGDHLAWCRERLDELGSRPSLLNPLWYAGSVAIGALAGLCRRPREPRVHGGDGTAGRRAPRRSSRTPAGGRRAQSRDRSNRCRPTRSAMAARRSPRAPRRCRNRCRASCECRPGS